MGRYLDLLNERVRIVDSKYYRDQYQSFLTATEWRNVEMAEEFAEFLREKNSMYQYPYFRQIWDMWGVFADSYRAARKYNSRGEVLTSEHMVTSLFVTFFTTLEFIPKGLTSLLLYPFVKKTNDTAFQKALAEHMAIYARRLQTVPFYDHPYKEDREKLKKAYAEANDKTWVDRLTWAYTSVELVMRRFGSLPLSYWFHQEDNVTAPTTDILVKYRDISSSSLEQSRHEFINQLHQAKTTKRGKSKRHIRADVVDENLYCKEPKTKDGQTYTSVYARLRVPRYADFQPTLRALEAKGIHVKKIAGQDRVQVKCEVSTDTPETMEAGLSALCRAANVAAPLYAHGDRIHVSRTMCFFDVPVTGLYEQLQSFDGCKDQGAEVKFIHNF